MFVHGQRDCVKGHDWGRTQPRRGCWRLRLCSQGRRLAPTLDSGLKSLWDSAQECPKSRHSAALAPPASRGRSEWCKISRPGRSSSAPELRGDGAARRPYQFRSSGRTQSCAISSGSSFTSSGRWGKWVANNSPALRMPCSKPSLNSDLRKCPDISAASACQKSSPQC